MSISDNIRFYRERGNMSQEDLAQRMPVDVSWIKYWEDGAGEPRLVDVARLSEVLGVTADDLIKEREIAPERKEEFTVTIDATDTKKARRRMMWLDYRVAGLIALVECGYCIVQRVFLNVESFPLITTFLAVNLLIRAIRGRKAAKSWRMAKRLKEPREMQYQVYDGTFSCTFKKLGTGEDETVHASFSELKCIYNARDYLILGSKTYAWILPKAQLPPDSEFLRLPILYPRKTKGQRKKIVFDRAELVGLLLFAGSILAFPLGFGIFAWLSVVNYRDVGNMWVFWTLTPIPIASIICGFKLKKKKYRYRRNLIAGFIVLPLLLIYGCFCLFFAYDYSEAPYLEMEQILQTDLPACEIVRTLEYADGTVRTEILFSEENAQQLCDLLEDDSRWLDNVPDELEGVVSSFTETMSIGEVYILIYNVDTGQMNELPEKSGTYRMYDIMVNPAADRIWIENYILEYEE